MLTNNKPFYIFFSLIFFGSLASAQKLDDFEYRGSSKSTQNPIINAYQFNGYTNHWHNVNRDWIRYGNLFKMAKDNVEYSILQGKVDIAEDMGFPGLIMQEGFMNGLLSNPYDILDNPSMADLENSIAKENLLIFIDPKTVTGKKVMAKFPADKEWAKSLKSYQYGATDLKRADAYCLENDNRKLFIVSSSNAKTRAGIKILINNTKEVIDNYDLHKGWFGAQTLLKSVTSMGGHPLEVIGKGMNEGNSWFVFNGYMDFLAKDELSEWMEQVNLPVITDVGFSPIYGCKDWDEFQNQSLFTKESWIDYACKKDGYIFRNVWDTLSDPFHYDGYLATEGNKEQIDRENVPFVLRTGSLEKNALSSMVLFLEKDEPLTRESMWAAIMDRREVGILGMGKMMGPAMYRNALEMLLLDREFLEEYFGDRINLEARVEGYDLQVTVTNTGSESIPGTLELTLPSSLSIKNSSSVSINLPERSTKTLHFPLLPTPEAMENTNPVAIHFTWNGRKKSTVAMFDLPQAISVHRLLYAHSPVVNYPVTIHNFKDKSSFPVKVQVVSAENGKQVIYNTSQICETSQGTFKDMMFKLELPAGNYKVNVTALGVDYSSQLGVGKAEGKSYVHVLDLNGDGVDEYRMENDSVQITLLATGARVIEYIIKSREDNALFKIWPKKAIDDKRPFRKRGYYPYGGFEDFLGQASMETHQVYETEILKKEGDYVRVRMWTDYFGNRLEKTFTLYGNSPLLEVRFALTFKNPEANVIAPVPILVLGKKHWTEDVYTVPELDGLHEYRMQPERYFGRIFFLKEGWNAGYDTKEDITFIGAYPVDQPLFLHMFMNHPRNGDAHHYFAEFQPWVPIYQSSTMYFSFYMWGAGGPWENGLKDLRKMNLITTR